MFQGHRIVSVTPAGRKAYLEILIPYLLRERPLIDEHQFWVNTVVDEDILFLDSVAARYPDFFKVIHPADPHPEILGKERVYLIGQFFTNCTDPETVYVRFDDDICWIAPDAVKELLTFRLANPEYFLVYPSIVNSAHCSSLHQRLGALPLDLGICDYETFGLGWHSPAFAEMAHNAFLKDLAAGQPERFHLGKWPLYQFERVSINCISWLGSEFARFGGKVADDDEEEWLTVDKPKMVGRYNCIWGKALVAHFAFRPQRQHLEQATNLLARYRWLAPAADTVLSVAGSAIDATDIRLAHIRRLIEVGDSNRAALLLEQIARLYPASSHVIQIQESLRNSQEVVRIAA